MVEDARKPIAVNIPIQYIFLKDVEEETGDQDTIAVLWTEMRVTVFPPRKPWARSSCPSPGAAASRSARRRSAL